MSTSPTQATASRSGLPGIPYALGGACIVALLLLLIFFFDMTLEDAHITFRYATHFADGDGLGAWNVGEPPVEGFTSFLWTVIVAAAAWLGLSVFTAAKILGALSLAAIVLICLGAWQNGQRGRRDPSQDFLLIAAVLFSTYLPFAWYAVSGMEAVPFAALTTALLLTPRLSTVRLRLIAGSILSVLMVLTRPEGVMLAGLINCYNWAVGGFSRRSMVLNALPIVATILAFLSMTAFRFWYFGDPLPNTYYAKGRGGILHAQHGIIYVGFFFIFTVPLWLATIKGLSRARVTLGQQRFPLFLAGLLAIYTIYLIKVGGDPDAAFPMWRQFVHIAPVWIFLVAWLIRLGFSTMRSQLRVAILAVVVCDLLIVARYSDLTLREPARDIARYGLFANERPDPYFTWLSRFADKDTVSAAALAGQWGWYIPGRQIDMLGLNNRYIAHFGKAASNGAVDSTTDMNYVLEARPDIIDGYMSADSLLKGVCPNQMVGFRSEMLRTMVSNPIFRNEYAFIRNAPYQTLNRAIFIRKAYLARLPSGLVDAVPVSETVLYQNGCGSV